MANFNRDQRSDGRRDFGRRSFGNDRPQMHQATCDNCGKSCEVPFRPNGSKPVYCSDCFRSMDNGDQARPERKSFERRDDRQSFRREDRPRFNREDNQSKPSQQQDYSAQFAMLNAKLDTILDLLSEPKAPLESEINEEVLEEIAEDVQDVEQDVEKPKKAKKTTKKKK